MIDPAGGSGLGATTAVVVVVVSQSVSSQSVIIIITVAPSGRGTACKRHVTPNPVRLSVYTLSVELSLPTFDYFCVLCPLLCMGRAFPSPLKPSANATLYS